jgi:ferrous iron transport protein A
MPSSRLSDLAKGAHGTVLGLSPGPDGADENLLRRLGELGFLPGEPVQLLRRGPGGREPIAVQIGETQFGLRLLEAQCVEVSVP